MTHHQSTGFLGSLATALLIHLAVRGVPPLSWGRTVLHQADQALDYCRENDHHHHSFKYISRDWGYFQEKWAEYLMRRNIIGEDGPVDFKNDYWKDGDPNTPSYENHDKFVTQVSYSGFGGSSGHDAPMLAYDAVLFALSVREREGRDKGWEALCTYGMFHCGDCDSTGIISAAIWGAMFGFEAYESNYRDLEYKDRLLSLGENLYRKSEKMVSNKRKLDSENSVEDIGKIQMKETENVSPPPTTDPQSDEDIQLKAAGDNAEADFNEPSKDVGGLKEPEGHIVVVESGVETGTGDNPSDSNPASAEKALSV